jgi:hypothetical protein
MVFRFLGPRFGQPSNGAGAAPARPILRGSPSPREAALERELAALRAQQAALVSQERTAAANLDRMRDSLDVLAGEIDKRARAARDPDLRARSERMITDVKAYLARQDGCDIRPATVATAIRIALGLERPPIGAVVGAPSAAPSAAPEATAQGIVDAGAKLRGDSTSTDVRTGQPRPLPSPLAKLDPVARGIVRQGRLAKGEKLDD